MILLFLGFIIFSGAVSAASLSDNQKAHISKIQIPFIENHGQINISKVKYYANTYTGGVYVTDNGLIYILKGDKTIWNVKESFKGNNNVKVKGVKKSLTQVNYYNGNLSDKWKTQISTYNTVKYSNLYGNIDLYLKAYGNNVEKIFNIKPGADPTDIQINISGNQGLKLDKNGELVVQTGIGIFQLTKPIAYQVINGSKIKIPVKYILGTNSYTFKLGYYNKKYNLTIDPLIGSTYLGGNGAWDTANGIVLDSAKNIYITGYTVATNFPTTGSYKNYNSGGGDAFISKFNNKLTSLLSSTYLGGVDYDEGNAIALDSAGNVFVAGVTASWNFPTTSGAYKRTYGGSYDVFVSKFNKNLNMLSSTLLGGSSNDEANAINLDHSGNVYITGDTISPNYQTTAGAYDRKINGVSDTNGVYKKDIFVSKLNNKLSSLLASTLLGGNYDELTRAIQLDSSGNIYLTGWTSSTNYPTTTRAYNRLFKGYSDVFVSKFNNKLTSLLASTLFGGSFEDDSYSIALDAAKNVYITGSTLSNNFPTTSGAFDRINIANPSNAEVFISKFDNNLVHLLASTFLGGKTADAGYNPTERGVAIRLDSYGNVYIAGITCSNNFPVTGGAYDQSYNNEFASELNNGLTHLLYSTFFGGSSDEVCNAMTIDNLGNVYITGFTTSDDLPTTSGAYDRLHSLYNQEVFVSIISHISVIASPVSGLYNKPLGVYLKTSIPGTIYYTKNGKTPSISSTKYTGPLLISNTTILKFFAKDLAGNLSPVYTEKYTIDKIPPKVSLTSPKNGATGISKTATIAVKFSENIKASTYLNNITIKNLITGKIVKISKSISGTTLNIKTTATRTANTWYIVTIPRAAIKDYAGNNLAANYTFKFKTGA